MPLERVLWTAQNQMPPLSDDLIDYDQVVLFQAGYWTQGLIVAFQIATVEMMLHQTSLLVLILLAKVVMTLNSVVHTES